MQRTQFKLQKIKTTMFGVNNIMNVINNKPDTEEENTSEHEHTVIEII